MTVVKIETVARAVRSLYNEEAVQDSQNAQLVVIALAARIGRLCAEDDNRFDITQFLNMCGS